VTDHFDAACEARIDMLTERLLPTQMASVRAMARAIAREHGLPLGVTRSARRFWARVRRGDGCWEWQGTRLPTGYGFAGTSYDRLVGERYAHRIAYVMEHGTIPRGMCICHKCDNPACVRPDHLFLGTYQDNTRDAMRKGRFLGWKPARDRWNEIRREQRAA
jgi:hypothetical protein